MRKIKKDYGKLMKRNVLYKINPKKANWIGHILRRTRLLRHVIKGGRRGRRRRQLL